MSSSPQNGESKTSAIERSMASCPHCLSAASNSSLPEEATDDERGRARGMADGVLGVVMMPLHLIDRIAASLALLPIAVYRRFISPALPPSCRSHPSCSQYTRQALLRFGFLRGGLLGARRITRCHPYNPGGNDPVPQHFSFGHLFRRPRRSACQISGDCHS